jgi:protein-L-isoaspartate(D-aspartate) O-methyltransferase
MYPTVAPSSPRNLAATCRLLGLRDERVYEAVLTTPRADFVPAAEREVAYEDRPVPIPHGQVTTQPSLVALMVEALGLAGAERVLEIGTGYGWQTALLARLATEVWSIERFADLADAARANLAAHGIVNAHVVVGDGTVGLPEHAPYDAIVVAAAFPDVPGPLVEQLVEGGRLVQPIGRGGNEDVVLFAKREGAPVSVRVLTGANFVRLVGTYGFPD